MCLLNQEHCPIFVSYKNIMNENVSCNIFAQYMLNKLSVLFICLIFKELRILSIEETSKIFHTHFDSLGEVERNAVVASSSTGRRVCTGVVGISVNESFAVAVGTDDGVVSLWLFGRPHEKAKSLEFNYYELPLGSKDVVNVNVIE